MKSEIKTTTYLVDRGGSWVNDAGNVRDAIRSWIMPGGCYEDLGFRLVRTVKVDKQLKRWREELEEGLFNEK